MAIKYNSNSKNAQIEALKRALDFTAEQLFTYINNVNATNNIFVWDGKPEITNSNLAFKVQTKTCQEFEFYQVSNTSSYSNSYTVGGGLGGSVVNPQSSLVVGSNRNLSYFDDWVLLVDVKNKTTYPVPSMFVYFLIQNANNKFTQKVVTCTLHVVSLATGVAAINAGAKGIQLLVALSEITSGLSGLATTALEPELRSLLGNDGYQNLQTVTALVDIAGISIQNMPGIAKKADNLLTRLDNIDFNTNLTPAKLQLKAIKDKLANVFGRGVQGAGSFLAKSGTELKTFLNGLVTKPLGKTYTGKFYKSVSKNAEVSHGAKPDIISQYSIDEAWGRYDVQGESSMYYSKTFNGNQTEMSHYGDWNAYSTYEFNNVQIDNMLDLTDDVVRQSLGTDFDKLVLGMSNKTEAYEFTNVVGTWARAKGYKGLIVPGARGAKDYSNVIVFNQAELTSVLSGITPVKLK